MRYDVIVAGCGAMGSSVSYNLARRGLKVATFDRFGLNHEMGSSHGKTRIIRLAYYEDPRYVPLLRRAFESWRELEKRSGKRLMTLTGGLMVGSPDGELVRGVLRSAKAHGIDHEVLSSRDAEERFDVFRLDESLCAVYEKTAGVLFPEECIREYVRAAEEEGCDFKFSEPVVSWKGTPDMVELQTTKGRYEAGKVVFCAGAWNPGLVPGVAPLACERQVPFWFSAGGQGRYSAAEMPVFILEEGDGRLFYGIPDFGDGVKVAQTHGGETCAPQTVRREVTDEDAAPVIDFKERRLRELEGPPIASTTCIYTNAPDLNFVVGQHPGEPRAILVSACSGHGFKFASVLGEVAAGLAGDERTGLDVSFLGAERFLDRSTPQSSPGPHQVSAPGGKDGVEG